MPELTFFARDHRVEQRVRQRFAGLVMAREAAQHVALPHPVLEHLRRRLDEVALGRRAGELERSASCVSVWCRMWPNSWKNVTTSVWRKQRRRVGRRLREVGDDRADRLLVRAIGQAPAGAQRERGGVAELVRPRIEVHVEPRERRAAVGFEDVVRLHVFVPHRRVLRALIADAEQLLRHQEEAFDAAFEREVLRDLEVVDRVFGLVEAGSCRTTSPRRGRPSCRRAPAWRRTAPPCRSSPSRRSFSSRSRRKRSTCSGRLRHALLDDIRGPRFVAEQAGDLRAHADRLLEHADVALRRPCSGS